MNAETQQQRIARLGHAALWRCQPKFYRIESYPMLERVVIPCNTGCRCARCGIQMERARTANGMVLGVMAMIATVRHISPHEFDVYHERCAPQGRYAHEVEAERSAADAQIGLFEEVSDVL